MARRPSSRLVFSSDDSRCITCGWPASSCRCSTSGRSPESVPDRVTARLRIEKSGRRGKTVTVIDGMPRNPELLKATTKELKKVCGTGGAVREDGLELQGDHRDRLREVLTRKGWKVKG